MNFKPILNVLGALLFLIGVTLLMPILISIYFSESDTLGFINSFLTTSGTTKEIEPISTSKLSIFLIRLVAK